MFQSETEDEKEAKQITKELSESPSVVFVRTKVKAHAEHSRNPFYKNNNA